MASAAAHADSTPSLKISDSDHRGIDVHCFAGCDWQDVKNELRRQGILNDNFSADIQSRAIPSEPVEDVNKNIDAALSLWRGSMPLPDTLGETYFTEHRGLKIGDLNLEHAIRYHGVHRMVVAQ
jgi:hypothetical protein